MENATTFRPTFYQVSALLAAGIATMSSTKGASLLSVLSSSGGLCVFGMILVAGGAGFMLAQKYVFKSEPSNSVSLVRAAILLKSHSVL